MGLDWIECKEDLGMFYAEHGEAHDPIGPQGSFYCRAISVRMVRSI